MAFEIKGLAWDRQTKCGWIEPFNGIPTLLLLITGYPMESVG
jgi:hypothetical protein